MLKRTLIPMLVLGLVLWAVGCSNNATTEPEASGDLDINQELGGFTATDEQPGFGDADLLASEEDEEEYADPLASSPEITSMEEDPMSGIFHLRAIWGQLCYDSTVTDPTDFSGSIEVTRGGILLRRIIRFEPATDQITPRTDRTLLEWTSQTTVHNDGVGVDIIVPRLFPTIDTTVTEVIDSLGDTSKVVVMDTIEPDPDPVEVAFTAGVYTRTFTLSELAALDTVVDLDDGNQIAFTGHQYVGCPRGGLAGIWGVNEEGQGVFRGRWMSVRGLVVGYLHGIYGVDDNGRHVFYGKWISRNGQFEGFVEGTYGPRPSDRASDVARGRAGGWFDGRILNAGSAQIGVMRGKYKNSPRFGGGFFHGRWKLDCQNANDSTDELEDGLE